MGNLFTVSYSLTINSNNSKVLFSSRGTGGTILDLIGLGMLSPQVKSIYKTVKNGEYFSLELNNIGLDGSYYIENNMINLI